MFVSFLKVTRWLIYALSTRCSLAFSFIIVLLLRKVLLRKLYGHFKYSSVILVGGAPSAAIPSNHYFDKHIGISSGSKTLVGRFNKYCDLSIMDASFFNLEFSNSCSSKNAMHEKKAYADSVNNLVVVSSNAIKPNVTLESLIKAKSNYRIPRWLRGFIVNYVCGTNYLDNFSGYRYSQVGTGAWTLAFLVFLKVRAVHITGINLRTGTDSEFTRYQHGGVVGVNDIEYLKSRCRNHCSPDINVFSAIALRYRSRVTLTTNETDIDCAISPNLS